MKRLYFLTVFISICLYVNTFFAEKEENKCFICMRDLWLQKEVFNKAFHVKKLKTLKCCHKKICDECYKTAKEKSVNCYNCGKIFDVEETSTSVQHKAGPRGNMTVSIENYPTDHCEKKNCIICNCESAILATFNMYEKRNGEKYYRDEIAYFPNNKYGLELLGIFKIAFDNNLLFQLGVSVSEGTYGIVFAGIHFKTRISGGATEHAYPDHGYLKRIKESAWNYLIPCTELNDIINNRKIGKCILQKYLDKTFTTLLPDDDNYKEGCVDGKKFEQEVLNTELTEEEKKDDYYVEEDVKGKKFEQNVLNIKLTKEENKNNNYVKGNVDGKNFLNIKLTEEENKVNEYSKNSVCSWYTSILCCC